MTDPIVVRPGVVIPADAIEWSAMRSSGPGGQNVNKVSSKVELRVDLSRIEGLDTAARDRLRTLAAHGLDADGRFRTTSQFTRDQRRNLEDACEKVRTLVLRALERPRLRRKTRPSRGSVQRRLDQKKHRGETKARRRQGDG